MPTSKDPAKPSKVPIEVTFTHEELEAIQRNREAFVAAASVPEGWSLAAAPKMADAIDALGLIEYIEDQLSIANKVSEEKAMSIVEKVITTLAKICAMHDLPFYFYVWANVNETKGDMETAKRLYALFLRFQSEFTPDKVDNIIITYLQQAKTWFNVEDAIANAQRAISERSG